MKQLNYFDRVAKPACSGHSDDATLLGRRAIGIRPRRSDDFHAGYRCGCKAAAGE